MLISIVGGGTLASESAAQVTCAELDTLRDHGEDNFREITGSFDGDYGLYRATLVLAGASDCHVDNDDPLSPSYECQWEARDPQQAEHRYQRLLTEIRGCGVDAAERTHAGDSPRYRSRSVAFDFGWLQPQITVRRMDWLGRRREGRSTIYLTVEMNHPEGPVAR